MAYNAQGEWQDEDAGVQGRVAGMLKQDSPLMAAARTDAMKMGNKRGILNSTMTAQAGTRAGIDAVIPIASQEAGQIAQRNLSGQGFKQEGVLQGKRIESSEKIATMQDAGMDRRLTQELGTRTTIASDDRAARSSDLLRELTSRETVAGADRTARSSDLGRELTSREGIAGADRTARSSDLGRELTSREGIAGADRTARTGDLRTELTSREGIAASDRYFQAGTANADRTSREGMAREDRVAAGERAGADLTSRENIARDDRATTGTNSAASAVAQANSAYTSGYNAIMSNPNIPEAARGTHLVHLKARLDADMVLIEGLYNVDLDWEIKDGAATA